MLDENLPTFHAKPSDASPLNSILFFTHNGSDPSPEYIIRRADASSARGKYAVALTDTFSSAIIYAEVLVAPQWTQPTLSAAEIRAQQQQGGGSSAAGAQTPIIPDTVSLQLYNPDQVVKMTMVAGSWNKSDSWEFEMPERSFKPPSSSEIDRESPTADLAPKVVFKWKRDGRLSKDMTCYMVGRSVGGRKSKEPDITVAMFTQRTKGESAVTVYEPNLARVEVEDRKGLEVVLLLGAEVIRELYLSPKSDPFNLGGMGSPTGAAAGNGTSNGRRKNSRPSPSGGAAAAGGGAAMSGAIDTSNKPPSPLSLAHNAPPASTGPPGRNGRNQTDIDAETRRLQAMQIAEEEHAQREREKRDREEARRLKKMLDQEEKERRRREAEVEKETERLRKLYGVDGQQFPGASGSSPPRPSLPPRPPSTLPQNGPQLTVPPIGGWLASPPAMPPRPSSAGPAMFANPAAAQSTTSIGSWWRGPSAASPPAPVASGANGRPPQQVHFMVPSSSQPAPQPSGGGRRRHGSSGANGGSGGMSGLFGYRGEQEQSSGPGGRRVQKKRSVHF